MINALYYTIEFSSQDSRLCILDEPACDVLLIVYKKNEMFNVETFSYADPVGPMNEEELLETVRSITGNSNYDEELKCSEFVKKLNEYWEEEE